MVQKNTLANLFLPLATVVTYLFLYIPIIVLVIFSFNNNEFAYDWRGFTTQWYTDLFASAEIWDAVQNSLIVAFSSVFLSLLMGMLLIFYSEKKYLDRLLIFFSSSVAVPEIVLAVGLLSVFSLLNFQLGFTSLIAGHALIGLGYVIPVLQARFLELEHRFTEASLDLGASQGQTLRKVILPLMAPALIGAGLLVFILSLDDFIIAFFCGGAAVQTLPMYIFAALRFGVAPEVSALSTVLLVVSSVAVFILSALQIRRVGM